MRFELIKYQSEGDPVKVAFEFDEVSLNEILEYFGYFLRACGFHIPDCDFPLVLGEEERKGQ